MNPPSEPPAPPRKPQNRPLRKGWTTGACATAAAAAAYRALLTGEAPSHVTIELPRGETPTFPVARLRLETGGAQAGVVKDAGDDPDVTHGLEILAEVRPGAQGAGLVFKAGDGIGTVTLPGLPLPPGEPAINPGPRAQITSALQAVQAELNPQGPQPPDLVITVSIPGGAAVAEKTMNGRLGIQGGLSVLGTTGVVVPFSCSSWIHAIHRGVDVARGQGFDHVLAATGRTSETAANAELGLPDAALIDMGDFAGGLLKYLRAHPIERLTIAGGFAKLVKLAQGAMDLHSSRSRVDFDRLAETLSNIGGAPEAIHQCRSANTAQHVLELAGEAAPRLAEAIARQARETAMATLAGGTDVRIWVYDRNSNRIGRSDIA